jgi:hypothetical protein
MKHYYEYVQRVVFMPCFDFLLALLCGGGLNVFVCMCV